MEGEQFLTFLESIQQLIPPYYRVFDSLIFFTILILIYSIFVFYFYKFLAKKNILGLDLSQYNIYKKSRFYKLLASVLYFVEYILLLPLLSLIWFAFLSIFLIILSKSPSITTILTISASLVGAVRITAYLSEDLSKDLAKMLPFVLLAFFLVGETFFDPSLIIQ
ncbi:hypothetical protein J4465_01160, partial [Candidatus Pacearchaeota archaeon]|nr:hypothetical protein [Candidatus Pacearchaeota archaeon]